MEDGKKKSEKKNSFLISILSSLAVLGIFVSCGFYFYYQHETYEPYVAPSIVPPPPPTLDRVDYDKRMLELANYPVGIISTGILQTLATSTLSIPSRLWPTKTPYPNYGALLPFNRIVAYYGNFYSTQMGILGQYPPDEVIQKLKTDVQTWNDADPSTPVLPAIDYIAVTAQGTPGDDGKYRLRMPTDQIDKAIELAKEVNGIVILDIQVGLSNVQTEIPLFEHYLKMPQVHLALDPEFSMKDGVRPGLEIGTMDAQDVNFTIEYLASLVKHYDLPPKILLVHRFTSKMLTNANLIVPRPEVQVVINMDGWGIPERKIKTYDQVVYPEPVQFAGMKLFYKNDIQPPSTGLLTPAQVLQLRPKPIYIQYQ